MKLTLHHVNFSTENVERMDSFYDEVLCLKEETDGLPVLEKKKGYAGDVAFRTDGNIQLHLARKDLEVGFRTGHAVNPVERGHIAYRTDDIDAFKKHLDAQGIAYSDYGNAFSGAWHQLFFYDPTGRVIEVQQSNDEAF